MVNERKCYRKGGRRLALENPFGGSGEELNKDYSIRAKQFGAFAALRGFEEMIEEAQREAAQEYENSRARSLN